MAIKINNSVVIDNSQNISGAALTLTSTISVGGTVGTAGSVLTSSGTGVYWSKGSTVVGAAATYFFSGSGTFTKPSVGTFAVVRLWGAGGSGSKDSSQKGGGGGGACVERFYYLNQIPPSVTVTIGAGGAVQTTASNPGNVGGDSTFAPGTPAISFTAYGGGAGRPGTGGGGGGSISNGDVPNVSGLSISPNGQSALTDRFGLGSVPAIVYGFYPGDPLIGTTYNIVSGGYDAGAIAPGGTYPSTSLRTVYGGASGGTNAAGGAGMGTIWGGGGGTAGGSPTQSGGSTIYGGAGGATPGAAGSPRGGGGGGVGPGPAPSGAGGDGYCEIYVW